MKKPAKAPKPKKFVPVSVAVQRSRHAKAARNWKPVPVAVQKARHAKAVAAKKKARGLALTDGLPCCAAEALAMSLRLEGWPVADADALALFAATADASDDGASIEATLEAAARHGLGGCRPAGFEPAWDRRDGPWHQGDATPGRTLFDHSGHATTAQPLILGVDLPGAHCVLATAGTWWSWGEPFDPAQFPGAVIEEAWTVTWQ